MSALTREGNRGSYTQAAGETQHFTSKERQLTALKEAFDHNPKIEAIPFAGITHIKVDSLRLPIAVAPKELPLILKAPKDSVQEGSTLIVKSERINQLCVFLLNIQVGGDSLTEADLFRFIRTYPGKYYKLMDSMGLFGAPEIHSVVGIINQLFYQTVYYHLLKKTGCPVLSDQEQRVIEDGLTVDEVSPELNEQIATILRLHLETVKKWMAEHYEQFGNRQTVREGIQDELLDMMVPVQSHVDMVMSGFIEKLFTVMGNQLVDKPRTDADGIDDLEWLQEVTGLPIEDLRGAYATAAYPTEDTAVQVIGGSLGESGWASLLMQGGLIGQTFYGIKPTTYIAAQFNTVIAHGSLADHEVSEDEQKRFDAEVKGSYESALTDGFTFRVINKVMVYPDRYRDIDFNKARPMTLNRTLSAINAPGVVSHYMARSNPAFAIKKAFGENSAALSSPWMSSSVGDGFYVEQQAKHHRVAGIIAVNGNIRSRIERAVFSVTGRRVRPATPREQQITILTYV